MASEQGVAGEATMRGKAVGATGLGSGVVDRIAGNAARLFTREELASGAVTIDRCLALLDATRRLSAVEAEADALARTARLAGGDDVALERVRGVEVSLYGWDGPPKARLDAGDELAESTVELEGKRVTARRTVDLVGKWAADGVIGREQFRAGRRFQAQFAAAGVEALRAMDLERVFGIGNLPQGPSTDGMDARAAIWGLVRRVGGPGSACGVALLHVIGPRGSLRDAADKLGWRSADGSALHRARGIILACLDILVDHYGPEPTTSGA